MVGFGLSACRTHRQKDASSAAIVAVASELPKIRKIPKRVERGTKAARPLRSQSLSAHRLAVSHVLRLHIEIRSHNPGEAKPFSTNESNVAVKRIKIRRQRLPIGLRQPLHILHKWARRSLSLFHGRASLSGVSQILPTTAFLYHTRFFSVLPLRFLRRGHERRDEVSNKIVQKKLSPLPCANGRLFFVFQSNLYSGLPFLCRKCKFPFSVRATGFPFCILL